MADYVERRVKVNTIEELEEALAASPAEPLARALLGVKMLTDPRSSRARPGRWRNAFRDEAGSGECRRLAGAREGAHHAKAPNRSAAAARRRPSCRGSCARASLAYRVRKHRLEQKSGTSEKYARLSFAYVSTTQLNGFEVLPSDKELALERQAADMLRKQHQPGLALECIDRALKQTQQDPDTLALNWPGHPEVDAFLGSD